MLFKTERYSNYDEPYGYCNCKNKQLGRKTFGFKKCNCRRIHKKNEYDLNLMRIK